MNTKDLLHRLITILEQDNLKQQDVRSQTELRRTRVLTLEMKELLDRNHMSGEIGKTIRIPKEGISSCHRHKFCSNISSYLTSKFGSGKYSIESAKRAVYITRVAE